MSLTSHRCCTRLKILEQAQTFSAAHTITLQGLCIHRKAINKNKPSYPLDGILLQKRLPHARQNGLFLFIALEKMVAFILNEGADMLLIWLLRARSYKTKAEA